MQTRNHTLLTELDALRLRRIAHHLINQGGGNRDKGEELVELIESAEVVPAEAIPPGIVTMNSRVLYDDSADGPAEAITLVYPEEADVDKGRVSVLSPLGLALLGARNGEQVILETPGNGLREVRVQQVVYQPEAAGDRTL
jgi:regulator of nucleoside diphosphate kinase